MFRELIGRLSLLWRRFSPLQERLLDAGDRNNCGPRVVATTPDPAADFVKRQRAQYKEIARLLREADPIGAAAGGPSSDVAEIHSVIGELTRAESASHVQSILHDSFTEWLGEVAGPPEHYAALAIDIWATLNRYKK
jgi:hypothetical protein